MRPIKTFQVRPALPERLAAMEDLAHNLRWSWEPETISLFRRLDPDLWESCDHNPVLMLGRISQTRLDELTQDEAFLAHMDRVGDGLSRYLDDRSSWYRKVFGPSTRPLVAYFSMEFGITECLPIYSGGLGILAGDHLKSASELGVPLVGVGILYQKGYFRQHLNPEGWQQENYPINDFHNMPVRLSRNSEGQPARIALDMAGRTALVQVWEARVGRVKLLLLDTNVPENPPDLQDITDELYGGDTEARIKQEIVLGIGGMRALSALGLRTRVYHMNEGHSAFVGVERIRRLMREQGLSLAEAWEIVNATTVFTTHTPVPAGIDVFPRELVERYLGSYLLELGADRELLLDQGRLKQGSPSEPLNMAITALRLSGVTNAVSRLHEKVSRSMWQVVWPGVPSEELPITHITNGVHPSSWISGEMRELYGRYLGPRWSEEPGDTRVWEKVHQIPGEELWRTHERRRERLVAFARRRLVQQLRRRGAGEAQIAQAEEALNPEALTIGFARRFAPYKRATLLLRDLDRLARILNGADRPVQIIFAGKAHPRHDEGKVLIRDIIQVAQQQEFRHNIVFLEDYDAVVARYLVQGCDVWLNTPLRLREACGTSGMKAAFNGVINLSILDGWWDEAYSATTGWAIGNRSEGGDPEYRDRIESSTLYELIEREVVPLFYTRSGDGLPRGWISLMKSAMHDLCPVYNTNRMVHDYVGVAYVPSDVRRSTLEEDDFRKARELARWRSRVRRAWASVRILKVESDLSDEMRVGETFTVRAELRAEGLSPEDLSVQVFVGNMDEHQQIVAARTIAMAPDTPGSDGTLRFVARVPSTTSGLRGFTVRVIPAHEDLPHPHSTGLITWAS